MNSVRKDLAHLTNGFVAVHGGAQVRQRQRGDRQGQHGAASQHKERRVPPEFSGQNQAGRHAQDRSHRKR